MAYVTVEGYIVRRVTEKAVALVKEGAGYQAELTWLPRGWCQDGDRLEVGDTGICVFEDRADEKGLDY